MLIVSVLGIVVILLTVSSLLIATSLSGLNLPKTSFRETITQVDFGSRAAVAIGLAEVSKEMDHKASAKLYQKYTTIGELTGEENKGLELVSTWHKNTMQNYPATGLNLSFSQPMFDCNWNDSSRRLGYSLARTNVTFDLLNYGFQGFKDEIVIQFNSTLEGLIQTDGKDTSFKVSFLREKGYPVDDMVKSLISVFFEKRIGDNKTLSKTEIKNVRNVGDGSYIIYYTSEINNITQNLNLLRENITNIPPETLSSLMLVKSNPITKGWCLITGVRDGNYLRLYINGTEAAFLDITGYGSLNQENQLFAAVHNNASKLSYFFNGTIDEIRIINLSLSKEWIKSVYNNVANNGFISIGNEAIQMWNGSWPYNRSITIHKEYIESDLQNSSLLIVLKSSPPQNFNYSHAKPTGTDIRFTDINNDPLDYEIEKWNSNGNSFIWVKVPHLSPSSDTILCMHYGNPSATDSQRPSIVWGGYSMVQHLNESTGSLLDSTSYNNDGLYSGSHQNATGMIDGADSFNGINEYSSWPHQSSLNPGNGSFTAFFWAYLQPDGSNQTLLMKGDSSPKGIRYEFSLSGSQVVFKIDDNMTKANLLDMVDDIKALYQAGNRSEAYYQLGYLRDKLESESTGGVTDVLHLIDIIRSQLEPWVRVVARDFRGITVSVYGSLETLDDNGGPDITGAEADPTEFLMSAGFENVTLTATADDRWHGNSSISRVEYYISNSSTSLQGATSRYMTPSDGKLDSSLESVKANISKADFQIGDNYLWIHANDTEKNWGPFVKLKIKVLATETNTLHISSLTMRGESYGFLGLGKRIFATVKIVKNETGSPVDGAYVHGVWSGTAHGSVHGTTLQDGTYTFIYETWGQGHKTYTFTVDLVSKNGYEWDHIIVSKSLRYPP